jgi:hypothetical protein
MKSLRLRDLLVGQPDQMLAAAAHPDIDFAQSRSLEAEAWGAAVDGTTQIANLAGGALLEFFHLLQRTRRTALADGQAHKIILALLCFFTAHAQSANLGL